MIDHPNEMKAVTKNDEGVNFVRKSVPSAGGSEVLVKVEKAGICGTDLAIYRGNFKTPTPIVMGHEFAGKVVNGHDNLLGKRVTSEINITCGDCRFCNADKPNHCVNREALGISTDGCFAEYIKVPEENLFEIPFSPEKGTFVEPLAAAIRTLETTEIKNDDDVLILGCGRLGLLILQVMNLKNVNLYAADHNRSKLEIASTLGAEPTSLDDPPLQFDIIVDSTGNSKALNRELELIKPTGTISLKSTPGTSFDVDMSKVPRKEITIQGSRCGPFGKSIDLLKRGKVEIKKLITGRFDLQEYKNAFEEIKIKNIFEF